MIVDQANMFCRMKNRRKNKLKYYFCIALFVVVFYAYQQFHNEAVVNGHFNGFAHVRLGRKLLQVNDGNSTENETEICNEPSVKEFPAGVFTQKERRHGAVLLHIFMALYMFIALAFVCDDYFVSSLDKICERLDLSEDVAGATFMAAGSSAPELFTSIIGVFIAKGDVGVGTIVGSAVFNILVIISICGLFAGQVVHLTWWPLFRDSMFYMLSIASLIWVLYDGHVIWYESLVMLFLYMGYILLMKFNPPIVEWLNARAQMKHMLMERENSESKKIFDETARNRVKYTSDSKKEYQAIDLIETQRRRVTWRELGMMIMLSDQFSPSTRFRAACLIVLLRGDHNKKTESGTIAEEDKNIGINNGDSYHYQVPKEKEESTKERSTDIDVEIEGTPFLYPTGSIPRTIFWLMCLPLVAALYFTIPDCRKKRWEAWYIATFLMSMVWIAIFSYLLVWMVCVIGFTFGIPDVIMGITFLAAGTSIPDAISSLLVAREGQGDMAVSNSIGSNVFDILIGLALPWFLKSAVVHPGEKVVINSRGMIYSVTLLFLSVLFTVMVIHCNKWKLDKKSGFAFLALYAVFLAISSCIELNVFGFVNYPTCSFHEG